MERIGLIGAGRAGTAVGAALAAAGYRLVGVTARSDASRDRVAQLLPAVPVLTADEVTQRADVVLVAVPDDLIRDVAHTLPLTGAQYVVHLSGAHGLSPLEGLAATPVALHPSMTFPGGPVQLDDVMFTATAPDAARPVVERLVKSLGAQVQWVADEQRALYHAGLVHGANHLTTLVSQAIGVLREAGVADPVATLQPLLAATLDNTLRSGHHALTGPIARGDVDTVAAHLTALQGLQVLRDRTATTYAELARATVEIVEADGRLDAETARRFTQVLDGHRAGVPGQDRTGETPR
ncbi:Rossmann-like and DUF2520 domain-containing protein [Kribbella pratensis]|jgi:predicted short-subunit dehydrogenase-like oxidoreductase (DUF2520 family)|uniref:Short-subunit dehydrogenase-like oxidoreductase (DUF2520 family) n=1 Tax=Kribbella pratensis TaxID=2512112 RepID=A0A4R8BS39_9ACTN|nr:Rossmann-like and DUF2520 domain-containing protein [Kribbella pratensis]TDW60598.1 putative short-subunit dehydrogenase-like oxidoreductase (DUF2520 family) [Kribbella pratensis]